MGLGMMGSYVGVEGTYAGRVVLASPVPAWSRIFKGLCRAHLHDARGDATAVGWSGIGDAHLLRRRDAFDSAVHPLPSGKGRILMGCRVRTMMVLAAVALLAPRADAFSMGEVVATTGVQGTLAKSGASSAAGTIGSVKRSLGASVALKQGQLDGAAGPIAWGGKGGGQSGWATPGGGASGWATPGGASGWATVGGTGGWATASNAGSAWASGAWGSSVAH